MDYITSNTDYDQCHDLNQKHTDKHQHYKDATCNDLHCCKQTESLASQSIDEKQPYLNLVQPISESHNFLNTNYSNNPQTAHPYRRTRHSNCNNYFVLWLQKYCSTKMAILVSFFGITFLSVTLFLVLPGSSFLFEEPSAGQTGPLRVASFNIRHFGKTLMSQDDIASNIVKIFQRYDVVLVMEVRDSTHGALNNLKSQLNSAGSETSWEYISSAPLGRSTYKEQYVFFYRSNSVKVISSYQVSDHATDIYEREPYAVEFEYTSKSYNDGKKRIVFLGIHTKPTLAFSELQALPNDVRKVASHYSDTLGVITMGDFNSDCKYVSQSRLDNLEIFHGHGFRSQISDSTDTTVMRNTDCAYDRIVAYGDRIDIRNSDVFNFEPLLHITDDTEALRISDHYPVEFLLY